MAEVKKNNSEEKIWGAVGYLWILSLVALAARKDNEYVRFHASQGALLALLSVVFMFIPVLGWLANILVAVLAIVGIIKSLQGERWELPIVGSLAQNFGNWIIKTIKL